MTDATHYSPTLDFGTAAELLDAMSNAKRLRVLQLLASNEMSVNALAAEVDLSQSALSQHLQKLRLANLVEPRRQAQNIYYAIKSPGVLAVLSALRQLYDAEK
jgi:DNA-binding transcriptional ArsR family regulator